MVQTNENKATRRTKQDSQTIDQFITNKQENKTTHNSNKRGVLNPSQNYI